MELVLALDAGTSSVRCVAFDERLGEVALAQRPLTQHFPAPGEVEHDPAEIADLAVATLREVATAVRHEGHRVVALGITNQRETTLAFDRETGHLGGRALVWQDRRTDAACHALRERGLEAEVRARTGLVLDPYFSATKMRWLLEHDATASMRAPSLATIDTYLLWWLTGNTEGGVFASEPSNASRTLLMDLDTLEWSKHLGDLFGVPSSMLAEIRPSTQHFGVVSAEVVPDLAGVPITGVLGDQQAALFGQACFATGAVKATYGTGAFLLANAGEDVPEVVPGLLSTLAWDLGAFGPATYALEGSSFVAGAAVQWLRDELHFLESSSDLEALATSVADSAGVAFVPAFSGLGSPFWRSDARGALTGLSRGVTRAHVARALVEALAYQVSAMTDAFRDGGLTLVELRADGGAAVMDLLLELQATTSRLVVRRSRSLEATARGAASIAGLSAGLYESLEHLGELWESSATFEPGDPTFADLGYQAWRRAVERA